MFGHDAAPTRVYSYGCYVLPESEQAVYQQLRAATAYRNTLVEIELRRRAAVDKLLCDLSPDLHAAEASIAEAERLLEDLFKRGGAERSAARSREISDATKAEITACKARLKTLRATRKDLRAKLFASDAFKERQQQIDADDKAERMLARAKCGLYWGTYLVVEQAMQDCRKGAPPRFQRFTGDGRIAVQIQGGAPADKLFAGDTRVQIDPVPLKAVRDPLHAARIRIGSAGKAGREPIWAQLRLRLHREIPSDASVKWVWLLARRVGVHTQWRLQFVLARTAGWAQPGRRTDGGAVAVDVGWRVLPSGDLRAALWVGDDGRWGEVRIPRERLERVRKVEDLQSIRDKHFDAIRATLSSWLARHTSAAMPQELRDRFATMAQWRSQARLAAAVIAWRGQRFDGDTEMFDAVEAWRKQDKHLLTWEEHQRIGEQRWRRNLYRNVAADLSRRYRTCVVEDTDWSTFQRDEAMERDDGAFLTEDVYRRTVAVSTLLGTLKHRMVETVAVSAKHTTQRCHVCGTLNEFDAARHLKHVCTNCGAAWDQDYNACMNLLRLAKSDATAAAS